MTTMTHHIYTAGCANKWSSSAYMHIGRAISIVLEVINAYIITQ